jgi:hypothetical protein
MGKFGNLITEGFMEKLELIMEYGFAYLSTHPDDLEYINFYRKRIEKFDKLQEKFPCKKKYLQKFTEHAFIDYITSLSQMAFKYMRQHPEKVDIIRSFFDEHKFIRKKILKSTCNKSKRDKNSSQFLDKNTENTSDDNSESEVFIGEIRKLFKKLDNVQKQAMKYF